MKPHKVRLSDCVIHVKKQHELVSHSVMVAKGYRFLMSHISLQALTDEDPIIEVTNRHVTICMVEHDEVNLYAQ